MENIMIILGTILLFVVSIGSIVWSLYAAKRRQEEFEALFRHKKVHK